MQTEGEGDYRPPPGLPIHVGTYYAIVYRSLPPDGASTPIASPSRRGNFQTSQGPLAVCRAVENGRQIVYTNENNLSAYTNSKEKQQAGE